MTISILIIEDTATQAKMLKRMLETGGYAVSVAMGAEEGLTMMRTEPPQMVLVDVNMPDVDGYEFCRRAKADAALSAVPAVLMVSLTQVADIQPILLCGADDLVLKSFDTKYFLPAVKRVFDNSQIVSTHKENLELSIGADKIHASISGGKLAAMLVSTFDIAVHQQKSK